MSKIKSRNIILAVISIVLTGVMIFSAYKIYVILNNYREEQILHDELLAFSPENFVPDEPIIPDSSETTSSTEETKKEPAVVGSNASVKEMKKKWSDTVGWITVGNSQVNYPFVQTHDNKKYVNHAINGSYLAAGTIFMDCRNSAAFADFTTVLYGHHMKNGSMFGSISKFKHKSNFDACKGGTIFLENKTFKLEPLAYMVIPHNDAVIYCFDYNTEESKQEFLNYVKANAKNYNDIPVSTSDKFVILSTCDYTFENARCVLILKIN